MEITYRPIGIIHSPFQDITEMPIQPTGAFRIRGYIRVFPEFAPGLKDLKGFSHVILLYHLHLVQETKLIVTPFMDSQPHGVFATRAPKRPNPIGLSIVKLLSVEQGEQNILHIENVDIVDGTPLLDIKPYVPEFDTRQVTGIGWLEKNVHKLSASRDDGRFTD